MRAVDMIVKKRDGQALTQQEIDFLIQGYARGEIPDYQMSAWAMAVMLKGMTHQETVDLTLSMARSGETLDLHDVAPFVVDKHSTGGVGDKTTLVVAPLVAACGLPVGKMSGRGLGFSGGTLDKLESIPGYIVSLSIEAFKKQLCEVGLVVAGQTADLAPADGKLYALRDVTGTVPSLPLIASSIMSKKIAAGADAIVLDVKTGSGAFMKTLDEARALAQIMVEIGRGVGRRVSAVLSDMSQPLGLTVGNALEVIEALEALRGRGPADFVEHCLAVAEQILILGGKADDVVQARALLTSALNDGQALDAFMQWIAAQGGNVSALGDPPSLAQAAIIEPVSAPRSGFVAAIDAMEVGLAAVELGAGRLKKGDPVDHAVGVVLGSKVGDAVQAGKLLFTIHANDRANLEAVRRRLLVAYEWSDTPVEPPPLVYEVIR
ncbi:MAG: pyrimidine-nucleoside phosphorylase [Anaerolineae bacterium]|nr:pyrimidine-nucleoside phosphorylase [Anaerolineae bacterium]